MKHTLNNNKTIIYQVAEQHGQLVGRTSPASRWIFTPFSPRQTCTASDSSGGSFCQLSEYRYRYQFQLQYQYYINVRITCSISVSADRIPRIALLDPVRPFLKGEVKRRRKGCRLARHEDSSEVTPGRVRSGESGREWQARRVTYDTSHMYN